MARGGAFVKEERMSLPEKELIIYLEKVYDIREG
jgi:hypothetical protein